MALRFKNIPIEVPELFDKAKENGFTRQGELFDIVYLFKLVSMFYVNSEIIEFDRIELRKGCNEVMRHLKEKRLVLIAYDSDFNFEPCFKRGTKAHWCLVSGFVCPEEDEPELDKLYVIATHGKSSHRAFWSLKKLVASNLQLREVGELRSNADQYILPANGSISETLSAKFLVIYWIFFCLKLFQDDNYFLFIY